MGMLSAPHAAVQHAARKHRAHMLSMDDLFGGSKKHAHKAKKVAKAVKKVAQKKIAKKVSATVAKATKKVKVAKTSKQATKAPVKVAKAVAKTEDTEDDMGMDNDAEESSDDLDALTSFKRLNEPTPAESTHLLDRMMGGGSGAVISDAPQRGAKSLLDNMMGMA